MNFAAVVNYAYHTEERRIMDTQDPLRRIVDMAIFPNADPRADQNIWSIGRAVLQVFETLDEEKAPGPRSDAAALSDIKAILDAAKVPGNPSLQQRVSDLAFNTDRRTEKHRADVTKKLIRQLAHALSPQNQIHGDEDLLERAEFVMRAWAAQRRVGQELNARLDDVRKLLDPGGVHPPGIGVPAIAKDFVAAVTKELAETREQLTATGRELETLRRAASDAATALDSAYRDIADIHPDTLVEVARNAAASLDSLSEQLNMRDQSKEQGS